MKVLITGAGGQVGRALLRSAPSGYQIIAVTRAELDITDRAQVERCLSAARPDVLLNAAAYTAVDRAELEPDLAQACNATGPSLLASAAVNCGARMVHISTDFVFDGASSRPYAPVAAVNPLSVYGASKLAGERAVLDAQPGAAVLRTAWVYSATGHNFALTMLRLMKQGAPVRVVADQVGTPTAAGSVAAALWAMVARTEVCGVHHWTDVGVASWYDFAVAIMEEGCALGLLPQGVQVEAITTAEYTAAKARRPQFSVLDTTQTQRALALRPLHWRAQLRSVLQELAHG